MDTYCQNLNKYENNKNITGQELAQILNKRYTDRDFGLSILVSITFFKKYNLGLKVFNIYYKLIYEYIPDTIFFHGPCIHCFITLTVGI